MKAERHFYLVKVQFLGFRYNGWQQQPGQKTIEGMLVKTLKFILDGRKFKILGAGRTDAKVSASEAAFELFLDGNPITCLPDFLNVFNNNLPPDIRALDMKEVDSSFNIIRDPKTKEYVYLFSYGKKSHPFCAPFITTILEDLDLELMIKATQLFVGTHDFSAYTAKSHNNAERTKTVKICEIRENTLLTANFFPQKSYALHVVGKGFIRYQVRMMMGALIQLGRGELTIMDIEKSLKKNSSIQLSFVAPGSGLFLNQLHFDI